MRKISLASTG
jgi:hypothetical protein